MNKFYEIPVEELQQIDPEWETRRTNVDRTKALIHVEILDALVAAMNEGIMTLEEGEVQTSIVPYPIYQGYELSELLNTPEWTSEETPM